MLYRIYGGAHSTGPALPPGIDPCMTLRVWAIGPRTRVERGRGAVAVESIRFDLEALRSQVQLAVWEMNYHTPAAGDPWIDYRIGPLTEGQAGRVQAMLAASGLLEDVFGNVPDGEGCATVADVAAARRAGEWVAAAAAQVRQAGDDTMPAGWQRYRTDERVGAGSGSVIWPSGDASGYVAFFGAICPHGILAWPEGDPAGAAIADAGRWLAALKASGEVAPVPRRILAAATWRAGFRNIRAIADALGAERETIYRDLRAAGYEPTEHR